MLYKKMKIWKKKKFQIMKCDSNGHTIEAVDFGHNKFEEKKNKVMNFLGFMWKPVL